MSSWHELRFSQVGGVVWLDVMYVCVGCVFTKDQKKVRRENVFAR